MKRPLVVLFVACGAAALAGWGLAFAQAKMREHAAILAEARHEAMIAAHAKATARRIADLIREADGVVITYSSPALQRAYAQGGISSRDDENSVRFNDPIWIKRLAAILEVSACLATHHAIIDPISRPFITLYRNHERLLELRPFGRTLEVSGGKVAGSYIIEVDRSEPILALMAEHPPTAQTAQ